MIRTKSDCIFDPNVIHKLRRERAMFMLEVVGTEVFLLVDHWKYIEWKKKSPRVLVYKDENLTVEDGYYYNYYADRFSFHKK